MSSDATSPQSTIAENTSAPRRWVAAAIGAGVILRGIHLGAVVGSPPYGDSERDAALGVLCGVATAVLASRAARRVWAGPSAQVAAAFIMSVYIPAIHYETVAGKAALSALLVAAAVELFLDGRDVSTLVCGAVLGGLALANGTFVTLLPSFVVIAVLGWDSEASSAPPRLGVAFFRSSRGRRVVMLTATSLPVVGFALLHNWFTVGELVPKTTGAGINLYAPAATNDEYRAAEHREADSANSSMGRRLMLVMNDQEVSDSKPIETAAAFSPVLRLPVISWGELLPFAILGTAVGWRRRHVRCLAAIAGVCTLSLLTVLAPGPVRAASAAVFAILAAGVPEWLFGRWKLGDSKDLGRAALFAFGSWLICIHRPAWMAEAHAKRLAVDWQELGIALIGERRESDARLAFGRAVATDESSAPEALRALATMEERRGDIEEAKRLRRRLAELRPESAPMQAPERRTEQDAVRPNGDWPLSSTSRTILARELSNSSPGTPAWIVFDARDSNARALATDLSNALEAARWTVHGLGAAQIPLKPGLFLFAADQPTAAYTALSRALGEAGYDVRSGSGYLAFVEDRRRSSPNFQSIRFAEHQEYVLAVGRKP